MNMEDEMGKYREKIERRVGDRRQLKNDRRPYTPEIAPKFVDWPLIANLLIFVAAGIALYFLN